MSQNVWPICQSLILSIKSICRAENAHAGRVVYFCVVRMLFFSSISECWIWATEKQSIGEEGKNEGSQKIPEIIQAGACEPAFAIAEYVYSIWWQAKRILILSSRNRNVFRTYCVRIQAEELNYLKSNDLTWNWKQNWTCVRICREKNVSFDHQKAEETAKSAITCTIYPSIASSLLSIMLSDFQIEWVLSVLSAFLMNCAESTLT